MSTKNKITKNLAFTLFFLFFTLIQLSVSAYGQQYGNLIVRVVECGCKNPIFNAKVEIVSISPDPVAYTNSQGYAYFNHIPTGRYSVNVFKEGYRSKSTTVTIRCSQTTEIEICLEKIKVCSPGEIRNRRCAFSTQVAYEKCKSDGSGWETVIENCPIDYICENGKCVLNKDGWYSTSITNCNNGILEKLEEYRDYNCFGSTCSYTVLETRWVSIGKCTFFVPSFYPTQEEKDGWYDLGEERCNVNNYQCGYGIKERLQEYRDYTCIGATCTYTVLERKWNSVGECYKACPSGYTCVNGFCEIIPISQPQPTQCKVTIEVRDYLNNLPIPNSLICSKNYCYLANYDGRITFYLTVGSYSFNISAEGYYSKIISLTCQTCGNEIREIVYLEKKIELKSCDVLDGWYYTTQTFCEMKNVECGTGIRLRKEEYRDYSGLVKDISECKNYKLEKYRWVEDGLCEKECSEGYECSEGLCRKIQTKEEIAFAEIEEGNLRIYNEEKLDLIDLLLFFIFLILLFFVLRYRRKKIDC
ncbi:MAG: carboxypeptidase-like regulatory domain-containing protein [Candidatus Aenigmatarchaeota archaeon]